MSKLPVNPADDWQLTRLELELGRWGDEKDKYKGTIKFQNGECEYFQFKLRPDLAEPYIDLLASEIVRAADQLAERLVQSLKLRDR